MSNAPPRIVELVETFDRNIETYHSPQYNETQLRREFIDPFFEELGWDVSNKQGYAQAYKEVIHEDAVKVGTATKAPDYSFRIGGVRKFFLEAKKPSINIGGDPHPAYQLRRYAWSAKLPVSILTDFEEFVVYDCQMRPKQTDGTSTARIMFLTYKDYIDKWDKIADIFSKDAVLKGSFDKFAVSAKAKRGTTTVDKEFLAELEKWRKEFARIIALRNKTLSAHEINFAVQRTIDRIIFLRMCEDRGIEQYGQLQIISNGGRTYPRLCEVFERADEKYNSGLFHFHQEKDRAEPPDELTLNLTIDDAPLSYILHSLYYPQCPYVFSYLPPEILGNVYEQFLGSVIQVSSGRRTKVEPKPEVKKAGGIYYTPDYIVDYIVKNTVVRLLNDPAVIASNLSTARLAPKPASGSLRGAKRRSNLKPLTPKQIENIKILDPACGSGSFLLGAYTYLLNYHRDWYVENDPKKYTKQIYQGRGGQWFLTIAEKKKILLNNIFGVDIDSQAVEVTKLSLLLKVLEGESQESLLQFHERALPDLGNNIKCGNSLIGPDFFDNLDVTSHPQSFSRRRHGDVAKPYLAPSFTGGSLDDLRNRINPFDWKAEFPEIFKQGGFDVVIGNPPWGGDIDKELAYFHKTYPDAVKKSTDSFKLFISKSCSLATPKGYVSMIVPQTLLRQNRYADVRNILLRFSIEGLIDLGENVFERVVAPSCIFVVKNLSPPQDHSVKFLDVSRCSNNEAKAAMLASQEGRVKIVRQTEFVSAPDMAFSDELRLGNRICPKLGDIKNLKCRDAGINYQRVGVGMEAKGKDNLGERLLYEGRREKASHVMFWKGADIGRYWIFGETKRFCRPECRKRLRDNEVVRLAVEIYDRVPKILLRQTADKIFACIDYKGVWFGRSVLCITPEGTGQHALEYFLGLLNSKFLNYIYQCISREKGRVFAQVKFAKLKQLPIRTIDFDDPDDKTKHNKMVKLVDRMLDLHKKLTAAKVPDEKTKLQRQISATDSQIDSLVYDLYGLTEDEIKLVEDKEK